jgi:predicted flap endonuclease-1-like 5' DNA nuclease
MTFILPETDPHYKALAPFTALMPLADLEKNPFLVSPSDVIEQAADLQIAFFEGTMRLWMLPFGWTAEGSAIAAAPAAKPAPKAVEPTAIPASTPAKVVTLQPKPAPVATAPAPLAAVPPAPAPVVAPPAPASEAVATEKAPALLLKPKGQPDDLERIVGIGPKLKKMLNDLGVWHFRQIAAWAPEEVSWVNTRIAFKGRIEREGRQKQANRLARGGAKAA